MLRALYPTELIIRMASTPPGSRASPNARNLQGESGGQTDGLEAPWKPTLSPPRCRNPSMKKSKNTMFHGEHVWKPPPHVPHGCRFDILLLQWLCFIWSEGISESDGRRGRLAVRVAMSSEVAPTSCLRTVQRWANKVGGLPEIYLFLFVWDLPFLWQTLGVAWCDNKWIS